MEMIFTDENFGAEVLKSSVPVLVDFWAPWCGPCMTMGPIVEEIAEEMSPDKLKVGKCNVDESGKVAQSYNIMSIPTFLIFKQGQVVEQFSGSMDKGTLKERIRKHVA
jgi:thioredoxin 1